VEAADVRATERWLFISDLHLGSSVENPGALGALSALVATLAAYDGERHLVLLGDTLELDGLTVDGLTLEGSALEARGATGRWVDDRVALAQLAAYRSTRWGLFETLGRALTGGTRVHVVCGNHDVALARPAGAAAFCDTVHEAAGADTGTLPLTVHPWLLHRADWLYAEHGHLHHDLNRIPGQLELASDRSRVAVGRSPLAAWSAERGSALARLREVGRALAATSRAERHAAHSEPGDVLAAIAHEAGLDVAVLAELRRVSAFHAAPALGSAALRVARRQLGLPSSDYLVPAAARVHDVLVAAGRPARVYAFGHTHRPLVAPLGRAGAVYANPGTWSLARTGEGAEFPYLDVTVSAIGTAMVAQRQVGEPATKSLPTPTA